MREEKLIEQLIKIIDKINIEELSVQQQLKKELDRYCKFSKGILGKNIANLNNKEMNIKNYVKYILKEGTILEKREILKNMKSRLIMKNKTISLKNR